MISLDNGKNDWTSLGQEVKNARTAQGIKRAELAEMLGISDRHLAYFENSGKTPSAPLFRALVTFFHISVDQHFFPDDKPEKSTMRRQLDALLDALDDMDLIIVRDTAKGIQTVKQLQAKTDGLDSPP